MNESRFARLILQPSTGGLFGLIGLTLFVMIGSGFLYVSHTGLFYEYLFGPDSTPALIETSRSTISLFNNTVFGNSTLNKILFFAFWMVVGLVVYLVVTGFGASVSAVEHAVEETRFVHAKRWQISSAIGLRVVLLFIAFGLNVMYLVLFFKILLPFGVLCARIVAGDIREPVSWLYGLLGFIVLLGTFYIGMVLLRFLFFRPRLFGGWEDVITDEASHHGGR